MLASIRVTKTRHFLDAIMYSSTITYPGSIWFKSQSWTECGRSQYGPTFPVGVNDVTFTCLQHFDSEECLGKDLELCNRVCLQYCCYIMKKEL
jgi:hypothetical protein